MPSLTFEWLTKHIDDKNFNINYPTFIETGTLYGGTILHLEKYFNELHTIEIKKKFIDIVKNKYEKTKNNNEKKINFHLGDSSIVLKKVIPNIKSNAIFFLDGHWSSGRTGRGNKDCPIYEELNAITSLMKHKCIVIIDDCRLFGKGPNNSNCKENWEDINIENIKKIISSKLDKYYFAPSTFSKKDRLIIYLDK